MATNKPKKKRNPKGTNPVGRPKKVLTAEIRKSVILGLSLGCTVAEVSANTGVSVSVLYANFRNVIKTGMDAFKCNLKKAQAKRAFAGSDSMLIWLGKQYLDQKDKHDEKDSTSKFKPIKIEIIAEDGRKL